MGRSVSSLPDMSASMHSTSGGSYHGATSGYMSPYGPPKDEADFNCSLCSATGGYYWSLIIMAIVIELVVLVTRGNVFSC